MRVVALVGKQGSGKGTIAHYLKKNFGGRIFRFSAILDDVLLRLHQPNTRKNQIKLALQLRALFGNDILAGVLKNDILKNKDTPLAIIDGLRYEEELNIVKDLPRFTLLAVQADSEKRYTRIISRGEKDGEQNLTKKGFGEEEGSITEQGIDAIIKKADTIVDNNDSLQTLLESIDALMQKWELKKISD